MAVWAIADLHLSFGVPNKQMDIFGPLWVGYTDKIAQVWHQLIQPEDLVLIAGDISWATQLEEALPDLQWIDSLPGTKVMIKGNHDYWWHSLAKIKKQLPSSCHVIQNDSFTWQDVTIAGTRLWDVPGLNFQSIIDFKDQKVAKVLTQAENLPDQEKIYKRELNRLETSLKTMNSSASKRVVMTHYPPIGPNLEETDVSRLLEKYGVDTCVFGHLHNVKPDLHLFGTKNHVRYFLTACDYLPDFRPILIYA